MDVEHAKLRELVAAGDVEGLTAALDAGGEVDARDRWGTTLLGQAAGRGNLAMVELLLARGADLEATGDASNTALMAAAARGHLAVVTALLAAGAAPGHSNRWGLTAADWARWPENGAEVLALLHGAGG